MPLCAVIVITSQQDTEKASADHESREPQVSFAMRNGEMSVLCLTDVKLMPRSVRYLDHRT
jgi:hypothetical protein